MDCENGYWIAGKTEKYNKIKLRYYFKHMNNAINVL